MTCPSLALVFTLFFVSTAALAERGPIAGLKPDERLVGAPVVVSFEPDAAWIAQALRGIAEPATGLGFLKDQGVWYTPFNRPNFKGRYDIRRLHADRPGN